MTTWMRPQAAADKHSSQERKITNGLATPGFLDTVAG